MNKIINIYIIMMLNNIFGCFFIGILIYILFLALFNNKLVEGLAVKKMKVKKKKFKSYDKDPIQMATKNEENIKQLRKEVDEIKGLADKAKQLKVTVDDNSKNIDAMIKQQQIEVDTATK